MQNQGIMQPENMGASGINTVAEAKCIFKVCHRLISQALKHCNNQCATFRQYTDNYNQQYNALMSVMAGRKNHQGATASYSAISRSQLHVKIRHSIYGGMMKVTANGKTFTFLMVRARKILDLPLMSILLDSLFSNKLSTRIAMNQHVKNHH